MYMYIPSLSTMFMVVVSGESITTPGVTESKLNWKDSVASMIISSISVTCSHTVRRGTIVENVIVNEVIGR